MLLSTRSVAALLLGALAACVTTDSSVGTRSASSEWLQPSPALADQIDRNARRIPWVHAVDERIQLIQWFTSIGEPAYPTLLQMVTDPRPQVASTALASLGATRDARLVEPLRALAWPETDDQNVALERARCLLYLGDWEMAPVIIEGLRDKRPIVRVLCSQTLYDVTRERMDYDPVADPAVREAAVLRWEAWWRQHNGDPLLADGR